MMVRINWHPSKRDTRNFGLVMLAASLVISVLLWHAHKPGFLFVLAAGVLLAFLSFLLPRVALPFYWVWMSLAFVMGNIMSSLILLIIFYLVFTPVAIFFKMTGRDALEIGDQAKKQASMWHDHMEIKDKTYYEHLF